jgi:benzylsuccinate CoA-transferase BbsF subunit
MSTSIFEGVKVADFTWAAAGPIVTKQLADNGATVIKVESKRHPDSVRLGGPFLGDRPGINRSGFFADFNSSKLGLAVNMGHPRAAEVIAPLIEWADIVAESFRPGVMARWGFGYERVREINPRAIMLSSTLHGAGGPWSDHPGYGAQGAAMSGVHSMTGWPDRPPAAPKGAYTDSVSPRFATAVLMAAMIHRERTGEGQYIELSQIEATIDLLTPELLELQVTGVEPRRSGNAKPGSILHGVYPCAGEEAWIAIEAEHESLFERCLAVLAQPQGGGLPDALTQDQREGAVAQLTARWDAFELMQALRAAGVPAGVALKGTELVEDRILRDRGHFWELPHPEMGTLAYNGPSYRFDRTPSKLTKAAPCLGEDTDYILGTMLGFDEGKLQAWRDCHLLE